MTMNGPCSNLYTHYSRQVLFNESNYNYVKYIMTFGGNVMLLDIPFICKDIITWHTYHVHKFNRQLMC